MWSVKELIVFMKILVVVLLCWWLLTEVMDVNRIVSDAMSTQTESLLKDLME